jgi:PPIC-type PPIASE domain/SurA-like N-terminal domain
MRKILIALTVWALMIGPWLSGCSKAAENNAGKGGSGVKQPAVTHGDGNKDEEAAKAEDARKAKEAEQSDEEAKKVVIAKVNGVDISMYQLIRAMNRTAPKYINKGEEPTPETTAKIRKEALDRLVFEELAVQQAIKEGINPKPEAVENVVKQVKKNLGTEEAYKDYLKKNDLTEEALKKIIERSQSYQMITAKEIYRKVKVDDKLLRAEYEKEKRRYMMPDNFVVDDVFFLKGKDEATKKKAGLVLETIKKNNNDVWKLILDGTFIVRQMRVTKEQFPEIYNTMAGMKVDELSGVIKSKDGFHIIRVEKKEAAHLASFEEAKPTIEANFLVPAQNKRKEAWERELTKHAKIETISDKKAKK